MVTQVSQVAVNQVKPVDREKLAMCKFEIGDFIDVAITMPGVGPASARRYGSFGMRRNGDDFDRDRRCSPIRGRY